MTTPLNKVREAAGISSLTGGAEFLKKVNQCPAVSRQLIHHLKQMFAQKQISPATPSISNELIFQHGIDRVINYLEARNADQEKDTREVFDKTAGNIPGGIS